MTSEIDKIKLLKDANRHWLFILKIRDLTPPERRDLLARMDNRFRQNYMECSWDKDSEEIFRIIALNEKQIENWLDENLALPNFIQALK